MTDDTRTIARFMIWGGWAIFLALLTLFFNKQIDKIQNPNQSVTAEAQPNSGQAVVLKRNRDGHYVASGLINGVEVVFVIDTGASDVSVPASLANKLGLKKISPVRYQTANGSVLGYRTILNTVQLGNIVLHDIRGGINPGMRGNQVLLGMTFLKKVEFTQRGNELIIRKY